MKVKVTRSSVCAGDSVTAPNEAYFEYELGQSMYFLLKEIVDGFPRISDMSDVMWVLEDIGTCKPIALVMYDSSSAPLLDIVADSVPEEIFCRYYCGYELKLKYPDMSMSEIKNKMISEIRA